MEKGFNPMTILKQFDRNGDGKITQEDFVLAAEGLGLGFMGKQAAKMAFKHFDANRNGTLEMHEALAAIQKLASMSSQNKGGQPHY